MLMLHRGSFHVTREELSQVDVPKATETWTPVPHDTLVTTVERALEDKGLIVRDSEYALSDDNSRFFGLLTIAEPGNPDYLTAIGLRNANDMKVSAAIALGYKVLVCDNLAFSAEVVVKTRHTSKVLERLPGIVADGVGSLVLHREDQDRRISAYKSARIESERHLNDLVVRSFKSGVFPVTAIPRVLAEYENPRHEEFRDQTVWCLLNAITETLKFSGDLARRTQRLHSVLDAAIAV